MKNSKLITVLRTFDKKDYRDFNEFLVSPYFNKNEELSRLYTLLRKIAPNFDDKKVDRRKIMKKLYPHESFDDKKCKYMMNFLLKLLERYISLRITEERELIQEYHLLLAYIKRGGEKNYNFIYQKTQEQLNLSVKRDTEFYYKKFLLSEVANKNDKKKNIRNREIYLQEVVDAFDVYYFANKLKYACHILSNQRIISNKYNIYFIQEIIEFLDKNKAQFNQPTIEVYLSLYHLLSIGTDNYFIEIKVLLEKYKLQFDKNESKEIYFMIISYCIKQLEKGNQVSYFLQEMYDLYQQGIASEILLENNYLSPWTFKNVVKLGLRLKHFDITEQFIDENINRLQEHFRSDAFHYNKADLYYYKNEPHQALDFLIQVEFSDIYYILDTKKLMLKIYFDIDEYDALESLIASFRIYLKRNKIISENKRDSYLNFIKIIEKINKEKSIENLLEEIEQTSPIVDQKWLLSKLKKS